jgi:predicted hydrocarbon binding protein
MNRSGFFKKACGLSVCSCVALSFLPIGNLHAKANKENDWKEDFIKHRYAKLIGILDLMLNENTKIQILEKLGRECAGNGAGVKKYINNPEGFFKEIHDKWGENATYNKDKGIIRIETPERDCVCPLIDSKAISKSVCHCSVGWQTQIYSTIFEKEVKARCVESVIRGSKRCVFEIELL